VLRTICHSLRSSLTSTSYRPTAPVPWPSRPRPALRQWLPTLSTASTLQPAAAALVVRATAARQSEPVATPDPAVIAYLQQHGIDAAQLQREQPQACTGLDLPLARLLVGFMQGCEGLQSSSSPAASEYAARLVFLAQEVGLPLATIRRQYVQQQDGLAFKIDGARQLLQFLQRFLSQQQLVQLSTYYPAAWRLELSGIKAAKQQLQQQFQLTDSQWSQTAASCPSLLTGASTAAKMAAWLQGPPAALSTVEV
jgi:hypothetical protein